VLTRLRNRFNVRAMNDDELDAFLERTQPLSDAEQVEVILGYFCQVLANMTPEQLAAYRRHVLSRQDGSEDEATMLEVVDGHAALRKLLKD